MGVKTYDPSASVSKSAKSLLRQRLFYGKSSSVRITPRDEECVKIFYTEGLITFKMLEDGEQSGRLLNVLGPEMFGKLKRFAEEQKAAGRENEGK
jgi:hypothetical protein